MKHSERPGSVGSIAGVFTRCSTPSNKGPSHRSPTSPQRPQTAVYLNSLELQASLTQQQVTLARAELASLQTRQKALLAKVINAKRKHENSEAVMVDQEAEIAGLKLAGAYNNSQSSAKRLEDTRKALDDRLEDLKAVISIRKKAFGRKGNRGRSEVAGLDRIGGLIVGQIDMYENRLEQQEQEITALGNRFEQELSFAKEGQELVKNQIKDATESRQNDVMKTLKLLRKYPSLDPARPDAITKPNVVKSPSKKRVMRHLVISL